MSTIDNLPARMVPLLGHSELDPELVKLLTDIGSWPYRPFEPDEHSTGFTDKARGFDLVLQDIEVVVHPVAKGTPKRKAILTSANFYAAGADDFSAFTGTLPKGLTWEDSPEEVATKLGEPLATFNSKKTGAVIGYAHQLVDGVEIRTDFSKGKLKQVQVGLDSTGVE